MNSLSSCLRIAQPLTQRAPAASVNSGGCQLMTPQVGAAAGQIAQAGYSSETTRDRRGFVPSSESEAKVGGVKQDLARARSSRRLVRILDDQSSSSHIQCRPRDHLDRIHGRGRALAVSAALASSNLDACWPQIYRLAFSAGSLQIDDDGHAPGSSARQSKLASCARRSFQPATGVGHRFTGYPRRSSSSCAKRSLARQALT